MANVQPENGCVPIAHDLYLAIATAGFTALERGVLDAVMYFTYGSGKAKSQIATEDIRYLLGAGDSLRTDRLSDAITKLIGRKILFRQELRDGAQLLGVQKDYEQWADKMSPTLQEGSNYIKTNTTSMVGDKMSPPERLLSYVQDRSQFRYGVTAWRVERKQARLLYQSVLARVRSGDEAFNLICDFVDEHEWMRKNVRMQFTFMASRFEAWRSQIPRKPREIAENEEGLGRRYRYDTQKHKWLPVTTDRKGDGYGRNGPT